MNQKRPIQRAIEMIFEPVQGVALRGEIYSNDYGDGDTCHQFEGRLTSSDGTVFKVSGSLNGVRFRKIEQRGMPSKEGRDVALHFALQWFQKTGSTPSEARENVLLLWGAKGWQGCSEDAHLRRLLKNGKKATQGLSVLFSVGEDESSGSVVALPPASFNNLSQDQCIEARGQGWIWTFGTESAEYGDIELSTPLDHDELTGKSGCVGFVHDPVCVSFQPKKIGKSQGRK